MGDFYYKYQKFIRAVVVVTIVVLALYLRLNQFEEKMTFHLDQGIHLAESREMVENGKVRLVGPMVTSKTFMDRGFFIGPQYYYVLAILGKVEKWDPLLMTITLAVIEIIIFAIFCWWVGRTWGKWTGMITALVLAVSPYLIIHSRFIWNPHMMLWTAMLATIALHKKKWLVLGILWGVAFGLHYSAVLWAIPIGLAILDDRKKISWRWLWLAIGFGIGDLPYIIFELRHNFYNLKTLYWVMSQANNSGKMEEYYVINPLIGFGIVGIIRIIYKIRNLRLRAMVVLILTILSYFGQNMIYAKERMPLGHPEGWTYLTEVEVTNKILKNGCPKDFNIASTISGDTRTYDIRYLLTIRGCPPMGVDDYPSAKRLFLIAPPSRPPEMETVWEVSCMGKIKVNNRETINDKVILYELEK